MRKKSDCCEGGLQMRVHLLACAGSGERWRRFRPDLARRLCATQLVRHHCDGVREIQRGTFVVTGDRHDVVTLREFVVVQAMLFRSKHHGNALADFELRYAFM